MSLNDLLDYLGMFFLLLSAFMTFAAGIGMLRFPDNLSRLHAGAKPQVLGVISICIAVGLENPQLETAVLLLAIVAFQMFTQPVSAHMVSRSSYRSKHLKSNTLVVDELAKELDKVSK